MQQHNHSTQKYWHFSEAKHEGNEKIVKNNHVSKMIYLVFIFSNMKRDLIRLAIFAARFIYLHKHNITLACVLMKNPNAR